MPASLQQAADQQASLYDGTALHGAYAERETRRQQVLAAYRAEFLDGPVLTLPLINMRVQFDPRNLQPLEKAGTVYPTMRILDDWGVLEAKNGALMKSDWSEVIIVAPATSAGSSLKGDEWTPELKPDWKIVPDTHKGNWILVSGS